VDIKKNKATSIDINAGDEEHLTFQSSFTVQPTGVYIYGFFRNANDSKKGSGADGIYFAKADIKNGNMEKIHYEQFTAEFIKELVANDPEAQKEQEKKDKKKKRDDSELNWLYEIEVSDFIDDHIVLLCTREYNYSVRTCNQNGACYTTYYCEKQDVTFFKIDLKGKIAWAKNLDRKVTYTGAWNIPDINFITKDKMLYVTYGSSFMEGAQKKNRRSSKSNEMLRDNLEYATVNLNTGEVKKNNHRVNQPNTPKKLAKQVSATSIITMDNQMYVNSIRVKTNPAAFALCLIPCPFVWYYAFL
ncbi:MAG: hypothetical protein ABUL44_03855, partial [Flavobacterium sp.]